MDLAAVTDGDLARADEIDADIQEIERDLAVTAALRSQIASSPPPPIDPSRNWLPIALGALSAAVSLVGLLLTALVQPMVGLILTVVGLTGGAATFLLLTRRRRVRSAPLEDAGNHQLREREARLGTRWSDLELAGLPSVEGLDQLRADLLRTRTAAELRKRIERDRDRTTEDLSDREKLAASAAAVEDQARAEVAKGAELWAGFLASSGLAVGLDRDAASELLAKLESAGAALSELDGLNRASVKTNRERETWNAGVARLGRELGITADDDGDVLVELLRQELANTRTAFRTREELAGQRDAAGIAEREADVVATNAKTEHGQFLLEFGVADAVALAARQVRTLQRSQFDAALHQAEDALAGLIPSGERDSVMAALDSLDPSTLESQRDTLDGDTAQLESARDVLVEALGERREQVRQLAAAADTSGIRQRLADERGGLTADGRTWLVRRIAGELLRSTRGHYEAKHRPAVLARAEALFLAWTDGEYSGFDRLSASGLDAVIRADDGKRVPVTGLSRGTGEQLYLAMRVALVEHLATQQEPLPLVMDDVLVNFDPDRAPRVARSIEEISRSRQVVYLTCHRDVLIRADRTIEVGGNVEVRSVVDLTP
ncbi:MAG: hypothetical protein ABI620_05100 [Chloroflexota bacterium]